MAAASLRMHISTRAVRPTQRERARPRALLSVARFLVPATLLWHALQPPATPPFTFVSGIGRTGGTLLAGGGCSSTHGARLWLHSFRSRAALACAAAPATGSALEALQAAVAASPRLGDVAARLCDDGLALPARPEDAVQQLVGEWRVEWSSMSGGGRDKAQPADKEAPPPTIKLRFLSFGTLPDVEVQVVGGFNRVTGSAKEGGSYELLQVFTVPGSGGVTAAMVLGGPWSASEGQEPGRASIQFQTVTLVPSADTEASEAMLAAAGLAAGKPLSVKAPRTYIDVEYIDEAVRVHRGESGMLYVLSREAVPFKTEGR